ncbi:MAG TPA: GNAT family N-acetyltransferase [Solirubrobacterales bacterium]|jgi:GNAT superfamily N-acetyltransferase|nr:GNAT family N-acetyltransferase [Solirubrobacterales bacterium]
MALRTTARGFEHDSSELDRVEQRFWREIWESVPAEVAREHGLELRRFGPVQATIVSDLPAARMMNLVLGATAPGALEGGDLAAACEWVRSRGVDSYVPVSPGLAETASVEDWLRGNGFAPGYAWMKFVRDPHPPRFRAPAVEVVELSAADQEPFGMIAATGFGLPAWAAAFFAELPEREGWRCYVARVDGVAQACAAMLVDGGVAEFGVAATLEPARGRGCQLALLRRRITDAAEAGCRLLFVETGERADDRPAGSYRNILRAGFEEAYLRPNWQRAAAD